MKSDSFRTKWVATFSSFFCKKIGEQLHTLLLDYF
nr:MAG TPA: hypothetical protein [Bacteriophage sp.]